VWKRASAISEHIQHLSHITLSIHLVSQCAQWLDEQLLKMSQEIGRVDIFRNQSCATPRVALWLVGLNDLQAKRNRLHHELDRHLR
jgi:hypothetical protein